MTVQSHLHAEPLVGNLLFLTFYHCLTLKNCSVLTHWGRVWHTCVSNPIIIASNNGLSPDRCQAITWTNAGILLIGLYGTNVGEVLFQIHAFSSKQCIWKGRLQNCDHFTRPQCDKTDNIIYSIPWRLMIWWCSEWGHLQRNLKKYYAWYFLRLSNQII